jgi:hypothetical protein
MTTKAERRRAIAHSHLMATIYNLRESGEPVPCVKRDRAHLWLSDDPAEQEAASLGCVDCPALAACFAYVSAHPEPSGVWAGARPRGQRKVVAS